MSVYDVRIRQTWRNSTDLEEGRQPALSLGAAADAHLLVHKVQVPPAVLAAVRPKHWVRAQYVHLQGWTMTTNNDNFKLSAVANNKNCTDTYRPQERLEL